MLVVCDHARANAALPRLGSVGADQMDVFTDNRTLLDVFPHALEHGSALVHPLNVSAAFCEPVCTSRPDVSDSVPVL